MNEFLEQIKGYVNAFEAINNGNYEGPDYLVDEIEFNSDTDRLNTCLLYTSPSPRDLVRSRMPSSA